MELVVSLSPLVKDRRSRKETLGVLLVEVELKVEVA